eukprot:COSAG06_NODE_64925_length_258_cov_0.654088_1_plen_51_part_10
MSKRPALFGKLAFGQSKTKKPRAFGRALGAERPPPAALTVRLGADDHAEEA